MPRPVLQQEKIAPPTTRAELDALVRQRIELQLELRSNELLGMTLRQQSVTTPAERAALVDRLAALDRAFNLSSAGNNEVRFAFLTLAVANRFDPAVPALEQFLLMQGRRKFVRPLITTLAEDKEWGRPIAIRVYAKARAQYHPVTTRDLDKLGLAGPNPSQPLTTR